MNSITQIYNMVAATRKMKWRGLKETFEPIAAEQVTELENLLRSAFERNEITTPRGLEDFSSALGELARYKTLPPTITVVDGHVGPDPMAPGRFTYKITGEHAERNPERKKLLADVQKKLYPTLCLELRKPLK